MTDNELIFKELTLLDGTVYHGVKLDNRANVPGGFIGVRQGKLLIMVNMAHVTEVIVDAEDEPQLGRFDWFPPMVQIID